MKVATLAHWYGVIGSLPKQGMGEGVRAFGRSLLLLQDAMFLQHGKSGVK